MRTVRLLAIIEAATITGPAKNLLAFAERARSDAYDIRVEVSIAVFHRAGAPELFMETARRAAIPVYPIAERGRFDASVISRLRSLAGDLRPDLVQSHAVKSHFLARRSGLHQAAPWVAFHHGYTWPGLRAHIYNQLDRWSLRAPDKVVTVSGPFRDELIRRGVARERIEVIHNAVEPRPRRGGAADLRRQLGIDLDEKVILTVGRLSWEKGHRILIQAVRQLNAAAQFRPRLLIVGDGPERGAIERLARDCGLSGIVTWTGQVPSVDPYYDIADVAVLSSLSEGSPNVLLEAMAARTPVVATAVGGIPEIVTDQESAVLVRPRDAGAMSAAIAGVLADECRRRRLTECAYRRILESHTPESRCRRLIEVYRDVLKGR